MDNTTVFTTALLVGFSGAVMPGPLLTVTISQTIVRGFRAGLLIVLGHALLEAVLVLALVFGLASFLTQLSVKTFIAVVGGLFLVYLGGDMAYAAYRGSVLENNQALQLGKDGRQPVVTAGHGLTGARMHPVPAGILVSLSNPYWSIWWATLGLGYITFALEKGTGGLLAFFSGHILADFLWYGFISAAVVGSRRLLKPVVYRGIIMLCGLFMIGLGGYFLFIGKSL